MVVVATRSKRCESEREDNGKRIGLVKLGTTQRLSTFFFTKLSPWKQSLSRVTI